MPTVEGAGVELAWSERGAGPVVLLVHGLAADARSLEGLADGLRDVARVVSYDRRGYGASGAPSPYGGTTVEEQAEDAAAVLAAAGDGPAVVAGVGFGALVALDLLRRHRGLVRAVALADPPLFQLVPEATEDLAGTFGRLEEAVRTGGPEAGVEAWLGSDADAERARPRPGGAPRVLRRLGRAVVLAGDPARAAPPRRPGRRRHRPGDARARARGGRPPRRPPAAVPPRDRRRPGRGRAVVAVSGGVHARPRLPTSSGALPAVQSGP